MNVNSQRKSTEIVSVGRYALLIVSIDLACSLPGLTREININYTSIVLLISHFLPHFLRLSVE